MKKWFVLYLAGVGLVAVVGSGCVASVGNSQPRVSVGQQLVDLQRAKEVGAITEGEFQEQKARLLESGRR